MWSKISTFFGIAGGAVSGWLYAGAAIAVVGLLAWGGHALWHGGANSVQAQWDAAAKDELQARLDRVAASDQITFDIGTEVALQLDAIHVQTITVIKEVPRYVTPAIDARYPLPVGLERVWNASALGVDVSAIPLAPHQSDDSPSGAKASDAAARIAEDNGNHRACVAMLQGLVDWAAQQHKASGGR